MYNELEIINIKGIRGYVNAAGMVRLNLEDVARGLGFTSGTVSATSGRKYVNVRWSRVAKHLVSFGILNSENDELPEYIDEPVFYLLSMKAENETAKAFQHTIAYDILPSIRRKGYYSTLSDEQLAKSLINAMSDKWKLDNVIIPALREGDIDQSILVAKYMGLTADEYEKNSKLLRKSVNNLSAKRKIKQWNGKVFTRNDIPETYRNMPVTLMALIKNREVIT